MSTPKKRQVRLGAHFPGVNNTTVWSDPAAGSHIEFSSFVKLAQTAERGKFDFFFLAEGLRLREKKGLIHDLDVVGRPDTLTVLAGLAAVTEHLGLIGTINATFNEPYEIARQFASLDHLSGGRAGWNVVTSSDAFFGENFRRGGFLPYDERYDRASDLLDAARKLWQSWAADAVVADRDAGRYLLGDGDIGRFAHHTDHFDIEGQFSVPRSPQVEPIVLQAGDSADGREFGAAYADGIFTLARPIEAAREYYRELKGRAVANGRREDDLLILPGATFILGDTHAEAVEHGIEVRRQQVSGATAIQLTETLWNRDLSEYDPDGPLPSIDPLVDGETSVNKGQARIFKDPLATAKLWREKAEAEGLSIRELQIVLSAEQTFIGTPAEVAATIDERVQTRADDGFILVPHITPGGFESFVDGVIPELQERGSFRTEYEGTTLRENLGLSPVPASVEPRSGATRRGSAEAATAVHAIGAAS